MYRKSSRELVVQAAEAAVEASSVERRTLPGTVAYRAMAAVVVAVCGFLWAGGINSGQSRRTQPWGRRA